jgi:CHAT domain-containing protein
VVEYLSEKILGPFRTQLQGVRRLIVSADGAAWLLPFDLLELEGQPLVRRMQVVMTPSVSVLKVLRERQASGAAPMASGRLLAVGGARYRRAVPVVPGAPVFLSRVRDPATPSTFELAMLADASGQAEFMASLSTMLLGANDLPGSLREVSDIARRFDPARVTLLTEQAASEKRIDALARSDALAGYDFLHFATHGFAQSRRPLMSALVMGIDGRDEEHDGYLTAQEIASWNLRARLVVLSACDSAIGATLGGEGALGLPYAFLQAGAAATIQSLWAVPDAATADWMPGLYDRMAAGETPAEALAQVKRRAAAEWTADYVRPAPWAAFVMYGG